ncbi:hypothetical protein AB0C34_01540 [Nocardia sp. NPDC049220]|uniref:hypothetical protein n=1 Tax=Nocardia sp. NPDC049220 TaxID=3155273 RepID=UPI0033CCD49D
MANGKRRDDSLTSGESDSRRSIQKVEPCQRCRFARLVSNDKEKDMVEDEVVWMGREKAERYLDLSRGTLSYWASQTVDTGPRYALFGRLAKYKKSDLDNWAEEQYVAKAA